MDELIASRNALNAASVNFLKIEVETGLTLSNMALHAGEPIKRQRTTRSARKAYDTIVRLIDGVTLSQDDSEFLTRHMRRLKSELLELGELF
jgi:hypothetical protein